MTVVALLAGSARGGDGADHDGGHAVHAPGIGWTGAAGLAGSIGSTQRVPEPVQTSRPMLGV